MSPRDGGAEPGGVSEGKMVAKVLHSVPVVRGGVEVGFIPSNSATPSGYPTIQLNSDTIYLEIASDFMVTGSVLQDCCSSPTDADSQVYFVTWTRLTGYRSEVPTASSSGSISLPKAHGTQRNTLLTGSAAH